MKELKERTCRKCQITKDISCFYRQGRNYTYWCKDCLKELSRQRVLDGRDRQSKIKYELKNGHDRENIPPRVSPNKGKVFVSQRHKVAKELFRNMKKRALFSDLELSVSFDEIEEMVEEFCDNNYHSVSLQKHPFKPSIDRIDPTKGYTKDNIRICWLIENLCKNTFSEEEVIEFCKRKLGLL